jgi:hypothetical protein
MLSVIFASSRVSLNAIRSMNLLVIEKLISSIFFGRLTIFRKASLKPLSFGIELRVFKKSPLTLLLDISSTLACVSSCVSHAFHHAFPLMEERRERRARWRKKGGRDGLGSPAMFRIRFIILAGIRCYKFSGFVTKLRKPVSVRAKLFDTRRDRNKIVYH